MSCFSNLAVTVGRNMTEDGGEFHTIQLWDHHDADVIVRLIDLAERKGYEVVSIVLDGSDFTREILKDVGDISNIVPLFNALVADAYCVDIIAAFISEFDCDDVENWHDRVYIRGADAEDVVREWADTFHRVYEEQAGPYFARSEFVATDAIPGWLHVDWDETLSQLARDNDSTVIEFNDEVFYFSNY